MQSSSSSSRSLNASPLAGLLAFSLLAACGALLAGHFVLAAVLLFACGMSTWRLQHCQMSRPRPTITYLPEPRADEPLIRLERGQTAIVPWPHTLQVLLPEGVRLQILEATSERVRVLAV